VSANERRAEIIKILEGRRQEQVNNLAFQLGVSPRTIRYDVLALTEEYPIETVQGHGGCVRLMKGYHTYRNDVTREQQDLLLSLMDIMDEPKAAVLRELLLTHGSIRSREKIEGGKVHGK
jgi:predicted DNA-binding transcriptional regulator YafY